MSDEKKKKDKVQSNALTIRERVMILEYSENGGKREWAYALAFMGVAYDLLDKNKRLSCKIRCKGAWDKIEAKLGGFQGLMREVGLDDMTLLKETVRLTRLKKPMVLKDGRIIEYDDGLAQAKGVEMLHKIRGSFAEHDRIQEEKKGSPLRLEFGNYGPIASADNVEIVIGKKGAKTDE